MAVKLPPPKLQERRTSTRIDTVILGRVVTIRGELDITIMNLSATGMSFDAGGHAPKFIQNELVRLQFEILDSPFALEATVTRIQKDSIAVVFTTLNQNYMRVVRRAIDAQNQLG